MPFARAGVLSLREISDQKNRHGHHGHIPSPHLRDQNVQVKKICQKYGSARIEEFIDGREFTVLVSDNPDDLSVPYVYPPAELIFPEGESFLHSHVKWQKWVYLKPVPDETLATQLMDMVRKLYLALHGVVMRMVI